MSTTADKNPNLRERSTGTAAAAPAATAASAATTAPPAAAPTPSKYAVGVKNVFQLPVVTLGFVLALYVGLRDDQWVWFDYHPFFMIIAWVSFASNAIMVKKIKGLEGLRAHANYMTLTALASLAGAIVIYTNKEMYGYPHLKSPHGQFGAFMVVVTLIVWIGSYIALNPDNGVARTNNFVRFVHKWAARVFVACGWYMCWEGLQKVNVDQVYVNMFAVCALVMAPILLIF